jgi:hypothetical protein
MPLRKSAGNMYGWVTHTHNHLAGMCPYRCTYCYVDNPRFGRPRRYRGAVRFVEDELDQEYGTCRTIFLENMGDLFADGVEEEWILKVLDHAKRWPDNLYVIQSKNPERMMRFIDFMPRRVMLGTTVETDDATLAKAYTRAPDPVTRLAAIKEIGGHLTHCARRGQFSSESGTFITVEPVMAFASGISFARALCNAIPAFVAIGADSKWRVMHEPGRPAVEVLIQELTNLGVEVRLKKNLARLVGTKYEPPKGAVWG